MNASAFEMLASIRSVSFQAAILEDMIARKIKRILRKMSQPKVLICTHAKDSLMYPKKETGLKINQFFLSALEMGISWKHN